MKLLGELIIVILGIGAIGWGIMNFSPGHFQRGCDCEIVYVSEKPMCAKQNLECPRNFKDNLLLWLGEIDDHR